MFRRAKLWIDGFPRTSFDGRSPPGVLVGRLGLTHEGGHPLCASVRPPLIEWTAAAQ